MISDGPFPFDITLGKEAQTLADAGYDVTVLCNKESTLRIYGNAPVQYRGVTVRYIAIKHMYGLPLLDLKQYFSIVEKLSPSVIHIHGPNMVQYGMLAARIMGHPFVIYFRDFASFLALTTDLNLLVRFFGFGFYYMNEIVPVRLATRLLVTTEECRKFVSRMYGRPYEDIDVVMNTPSIEDFHYIPMPKDGRIEGKFLVTYVGGIDNLRNLDIAIGSMDYLVQANDILLLIVAGPQPPYERIFHNAMALVKHKNLQEKVYFTGRLSRSEALSYLQASDICLLAHKKNFYTDMLSPIKLHEYAALGKAIITPPLKSVLRLYQGCVAVWDGNTPMSLASLILRLYDDVKLRKMLGKKAKDVFMKEYCWEIEAKRFVEIYTKILTGT